MMLASRLRRAKRPTIRSAAFFTDRCNLRSSLHSYCQAYRHQAQRPNSWFGRGTALRWNCACQIPTPWAFSVFSRTFIGRPSLSVPKWQYQVTGAHGLFTMQSRMMHVPRSKIMFAETKMQRTAIRWVPSFPNGVLALTRRGLSPVSSPPPISFAADLPRVQEQGYEGEQ